MKKLNLKTNKENKIIGNKIRCCIDCIIVVCCLVVAFNIHPNGGTKTINDSTETTIMKYIFHDYDGNTYILNDSTHGSTDSMDYLFNDEIPEKLKDDTKNTTGTVSLADIAIYKNQNTNLSGDNVSTNDDISTNDNIKDNQISIDEIIQELGIVGESGDLIIDLSNIENDTGDSKDEYYTVTENEDGTTMTITKDEDNNTMEDLESVKGDYIGKVFSFVTEGQIHPILIPRNQLPIGENEKSITYIDNFRNTGTVDNTGITIIEEYESCMTPRGYKIVHGDSVLAYQQMDNAPDICNIERRYCWKGKLSGTYTQQGCSINTNYSFTQWGEAVIPEKTEETIPDVVQNPDGSVKVNDKEIGSSFFFERPSQKSTPGYYQSDNIVVDEEVDQTTRPHRGCTTPWGEKMKHGEIVQAFKHANGFSDAPCEAQIRLCTMGDLMGSYTEPTCKTRETSFIDRINGSPTWETYSKEKLDWVKKLIKAEQSYDRDYHRQINSDQLDRILTILDS